MSWETPAFLSRSGAFKLTDGQRKRTLSELEGAVRKGQILCASGGAPRVEPVIGDGVRLRRTSAQITGETFTERGRSR